MSADKPPQLKPCPLCGGDAALAETRFAKCHQAWFSDGTQVLHAHYISCVKCGCNNRTIVGGYQTPEIAAAKWSNRAPGGDVLAAFEDHFWSIVDPNGVPSDMWEALERLANSYRNRIYLDAAQEGGPA